MHFVASLSMLCATLLAPVASKDRPKHIGAWTIACHEDTCAAGQFVRDRDEPKWWMSLALSRAGGKTILTISATPPSTNKVTVSIRGGDREDWEIRNGACTPDRCEYTMALDEEHQIPDGGQLAVMTDDLSSRFPVGFIFKTGGLNDALKTLDGEPGRP